CLLERAMRSEEAMPHIECEFIVPGQRQAMGSISGARPTNRFIDFSLTPMPGLDGRRVLLVGRDVTAARAMEQMKAHFLAMISHELRAPLQSISGFLDLVLSGEGGEVTQPQQHFLRRARAGSEHLTSLVDDLLLISRRDAGQFSLYLKETDLLPVVEEAVEQMELLANDAGVRLTLEVSSPLPRVRADRPRITQVLRNLISNAIKFTPESGEVTVVAAAAAEHLALRVCDTGMGIAPEHQARIFERFYQVDTTGSQGRFQGQGLGLAIVRIIVEGHGGKILLESVPDRGSTFTVLLPVTRAPS
ncbi:MAG: hypothetical protein IVW57_18055, partial [Ktedonobacterales bacterium]|nr:hypothetical protein [Ktedonobacterales bacterium]